MRSIITLLDKKDKISNKIWRLQKTRQIITKQIQDFVNNLSSEKKRFLDDKILSMFSEEKLKRVESYRKYMNDLSRGICNSYQAWDNIFDPYIDEYTIEKINVDNRKGELFIKLTVMPTKPSGHISLMTLHDLYTTDWFNIEDFENCN